MSRDRAIGIMCPDIWGTYFCQVLGGIQSAARRFGYRVIAIRSSPRDVHRLKLARGLIDGWIAAVDPTGIELFLDAGQPVVTLSAPFRDARCPCVLPDNHGGALSAIHHLIEHGHRRIVFAGNMAQGDIRQRFKAYQDALEAHGIPFDPGLVIEIPDNERASGQLAAERLLASGAPCTAMFVATDHGALGAMDTLLAAGRRIPEDIALVGFDDIESARYAAPPLTTVRQQFDWLGRTAAQLLIDLLAGVAVPGAGHVAPTTLIPRRSCGCVPGGAPRARRSRPPERAADWKDALAGELLELMSFSAASDRGAPQAHTWPEVAEVIEGLEAAARGAPPPPRAALARAWRQAVHQMPDVDALLLLGDRLERAGRALLRAEGDTAAEERVAAYVRQARRDVMACRVAIERARADYLNGLLDINLVVRKTLLEDADGGGSKLSWLSAVQMSWGCLGVWDTPSASGPVLRIIESACPGGQAASPQAGTRIAAEEFPPRAWLPASAHPEDDHVMRLLPLRGEDGERGLLAISAPVSSPLGLDHRDMAMWVAMLSTSLERAWLIESLIAQEGQARAAYERERALADAVRRLGCPVIPLDQGVLLVPLIGAIDAERAGQVLEVVLAEMSRQGAEVLLMDITGVPVADAQVAQSLLKTARAAVLLGAEVIVVGMRPQVAQGFTQLGIDLHGMTLYPTLGKALAALRARRRPESEPRAPRA
ncbi:LacI family transcriptional regulator [Sorangium cellulosum]|uniref:LacI family transcriptional regulator n=1 Tax=Sorangium cellulosum TaxID=56 RepID=A0A4P2PVK3_SORCE|nr:substrate-binding domain-containing protein [Sorangium cellulosum]AUX20825.1 LacI family transcriptional regulator [Sorangium cellulosum]